MAGRRTYPHGVTCWIDTEQPDPAGAARFYGGLFGWTLTDVVPPDAPGSYLIATLDGQDVVSVSDGRYPRGLVAIGVVTWSEPTAVIFDHLLVTTPAS